MPRFDKLLVLDLDETLVHATVERLGRDPDFEVGEYAVYRRPHLAEFIASMFEWFEVGIWTSASRGYAEPVVTRLLDAEALSFLWCRERCTLHSDLETRDLISLKRIDKLLRRGFDKRNILYVDDSPEKIRCSYGNYVRITPFEGAEDDGELLHLRDYLEELGPVPNVRVIEKRGWRRRRVRS